MKYRIIILLMLGLSLPACAEYLESTSQELQEAFNYIDSNHNGLISYKEFHTFLVDDNLMEMKEEFRMVDRNNNKLVSYEESMIYEVSREEFSLADKNNSGQVDQDEFISAYILLSFKESDLNQDGDISFSEFKALQ